MRDTDFTRNRKLGFSEICLMILKGSKRGLQAGIHAFLKETKSSVDDYSSAAFCKARQKIHPDAFRHLFKVAAEEFYKTYTYKTLCGYRIWAIDGSDLNLPNTDELLEIYGSEAFSHGVQVQAQMSCLYDVLNHIVLDAHMEPHNASERVLAQRHFECLSSFTTYKELLLMDRGYPSEELLLSLENRGLSYVIRSNKNEFFREVRKVKTNDEIIVRKCKSGELHIRVVSLKLPNGMVETLLTNITDEKLDIEWFGDIYRLRWGVETKYDDLKNKLELENFSGVTPIAVLQDFYATLFLSNILAYMEMDCADELQKINESGTRKHQYKMNTSHAISVLKLNVIELLLTSSSRKKKKILAAIHTQLRHCLTPVRNGRSFPRAKKHPSLKFRTNKKSL